MPPASSPQLGGVSAFLPLSTVTSSFVAQGQNLRARGLRYALRRPAVRFSFHPRIRASGHTHHEAIPPPMPPKSTPFAITTPLYYVNAKPHMGSAYPTIAVDALARYFRMRGRDPRFVTGCDEHGEKIAKAAGERDVKEFCDEVSSEFKALWEKLDIKYDRFVRTTDARHEVFVKEFMERVWDNGDIYKSSYEGLYCTGCEEYKDVKDLDDNSVCPAHRTVCDNRKEENYFFALTKYQARLEELLETNPNFVMPEERRNEVLGWVKEGLRDFSVSRANNPWGIPVPRDPSQTIYVWFDALLGYVSALAEMSVGPQQMSIAAATTQGWPAHIHVIGKDILRFHAVYWPAMLMSAGLPLPSQVYGHGFLTKDGMKMGKSLGNTLEPNELVDTYGADAVRYYFLRAIEFGRDGDFSSERFVNIVNADLANTVGNLVNRCVGLLVKNCAGELMESSAAGVEQCEAAREFPALVEKKCEIAARAFERLDYPEACGALMSIGHAANAFVDQTAPWSAFKQGRSEDAAAAIAVALESVRIVAVGLAPVVPSVSKKIYNALAYSDEEWSALSWDEHTKWGILEKGRVFTKCPPVFPKLEIKEPVTANV